MTQSLHNNCERSRNLFDFFFSPFSNLFLVSGTHKLQAKCGRIGTIITHSEQPRSELNNRKLLKLIYCSDVTVVVILENYHWLSLILRHTRLVTATVQKAYLLTESFTTH